MGKIVSKITLLALALTTVSALAHAQFIPDPISLSSAPLAPSPGEDFVVTASTPTFDKNVATFSWVVDGRARPDLSGQGQNIISLKADKIGSITKISVEVSTPQGLSGNATLLVRVSDLSLAWFAETYIPKWYKGKALSIPESVVDIVAIPEIIIGGRTLAPENLIYSWDLDDQEKALSGVGKQVFRIKTSLFPGNLHHVKVVVEDSLRQISQEKEIFILSNEPRVVIYQSSPLGGLEVRSAPPLALVSKEDTRDFVAEPFYFSVATKKNLSFSWNVAGADFTGNDGQKFSLSLDISSLPFQLTPLLVTIPIPNSVLTSVSGTINIFSQ